MRLAFFHKDYYESHAPRDEIRRQEAKELPSHYAAIRRAFKLRAAFFHEHGWLCGSLQKWKDGIRDKKVMQVPLIGDLGGVSFGGNWSNYDDFPLSRYPDRYEDRGQMVEDERTLPRTEDGRDFHYIGKVDMWSYIGDTNGVLVVFYDPKDRIVLTTLDWS